jgi:hypothetical protein
MICSDMPKYFILYSSLFCGTLSKAFANKHNRIQPFADDSMIYRQIKSQSDCLKLQEDLEAAIKWEQNWLISFHPDKCNIMNITTKRNPIKAYWK